MGFGLDPHITLFLEAATHVRGSSAVRQQYLAVPQISVKPYRPWNRSVKAFPLGLEHSAVG